MNHPNDVTSMVATTAATAVSSKTETTAADSIFYGSTDNVSGSSMSLYLKIAIGSFLSVVIFVSIFGNLLVCVAIASDRRLRRLGNLFLVSLAIADLCVGALVMTFALANDLMEYWAFGPQLCEIWIAFDISCSTCSIINLCAIALDRFAHIKDPMLYNRWMNRRIILISVSMIWLVSCSISFLPISLGWHKPVPDSPLIPTNTSFRELLATPESTTKVTIDQGNGSEPDDWDDQTDDDENLRLKRDVGIHDSIARISSHYISFSPLFRNHTIGAVNVSQSYFLPPPISPDMTPVDQTDEALVLGEDDDVVQMAFSSFLQSSVTANEDDVVSNVVDIEPEPTGSLPQCAMDLTPTYAVVSSCISFYLPCLIMLCLYARLYSICQQHVKTIKSMTKTYPGLAQCPPIACDGTKKNLVVASNNGNRPSINSPSVTAQHQQNQSHVSEHKAAITLGIIMGTFLACWMPFFCMNIVAAFCKTCISASVFKILTWLGYFNSCLNPAIYSIFNTEFRDAFRRILLRYVFNSDVSRACNQICKPCSGNKTGSGSGCATVNSTTCTNPHKPERHSMESAREELKIVIVSNKSNFDSVPGTVDPSNRSKSIEEPPVLLQTSPVADSPSKPIQIKCSSMKSTRPSANLYRIDSFDPKISDATAKTENKIGLHQVSSSDPNLEQRNNHISVALTRNESFHL